VYPQSLLVTCRQVSKRARADLVAGSFRNMIHRVRAGFFNVGTLRHRPFGRAKLLLSRRGAASGSPFPYSLRANTPHRPGDLRSITWDGQETAPQHVSQSIRDSRWRERTCRTTMKTLAEPVAPSHPTHNRTNMEQPSNIYEEPAEHLSNKRPTFWEHPTKNGPLYPKSVRAPYHSRTTPLRLYWRC